MCTELVNASGEVIGHVCGGDSTIAPVAGRRRKRFWCFRCRKHGLHTRMMSDYGPESYYDPRFWWSCPTCHQEHVLFPGREWAE